VSTEGAAKAEVTALAPTEGATVLLALAEPEPNMPHLQAVHEALRGHFPGVEFVVVAGALAYEHDLLADPDGAPYPEEVQALAKSLHPQQRDLLVTAIETVRHWKNPA